MDNPEIPPVEQLRECLLDQSQPMGKRTRAAFYLRTLGTPPAVKAVSEGAFFVFYVVEVSAD